MVTQANMSRQSCRAITLGQMDIQATWLESHTKLSHLVRWTHKQIWPDSLPEQPHWVRWSHKQILPDSLTEQ